MDDTITVVDSHEQDINMPNVYLSSNLTKHLKNHNRRGNIRICGFPEHTVVLNSTITALSATTYLRNSYREVGNQLHLQSL